MKPSQLAMQVALFHYSVDGAFVDVNALFVAPSSRHNRHHNHDHDRRYRSEVSSSILDESMGSSSASETIEMLPVTTKAKTTTNAAATTTKTASSTGAGATTTTTHNQRTRRGPLRHPLFRTTNAFSEHLPVPHPELWRRSLPYQKKKKKKEKKETRTRNEEAPVVNTKGQEQEERENENNRAFWYLPFLSSSLPQSKEERDDDDGGCGKGEVLMNDAHVQFDDPFVGARRLLERCGIISSRGHDERVDELLLPEAVMAEDETIRHLARILSRFQSVVVAAHRSPTPASPHHGSRPNDPAADRNGRPKCIARVVSTIGSIGTKCPRWHADHVPVRLVMSVLGPGCEYVPEDFAEFDENDFGGSGRMATTKKGVVNRRALNNCDEEDTAKANDLILPPENLKDATMRTKSEIIKRAKEGEMVLLMGRGWEDNNDDDDDFVGEKGSRGEWGDASEGKVLAAVHRSPILKPDQERILLTVDLVDW